MTGINTPTLSIAILSAALCTTQAVSAQSHWDWQLSEPFDLSRDVAVMDIDPDNHSPAEIAALNARGVKTICYVSVGTAENFRADFDTFPEAVLGKTYGDWPDERFLDIRQIGLLLPIMAARFQRCKEMGFAAIEPDNLDVYLNDSGFEITELDTLRYIRTLSDIAHGIGLEIGQKNVPDLTARLVDTLDFVITEDCFADGWCDQVAAYANAGKPIYAAEYNDREIVFTGVCGSAQEHYHFIQKDRDLTRQLLTCPQEVLQ